MRYIKTYEEIDYGPEVGDYVVCKDNLLIDDRDYNYINFLANNIGKLDSIKIGAKKLYYFVTYENVPDNIDKDYFVKGYTISIDRKEIVFYSKNMENCETYLAANKYNL